jgi:hypothetical protein
MSARPLPSRTFARKLAPCLLLSVSLLAIANLPAFAEEEVGTSAVPLIDNSKSPKPKPKAPPVPAPKTAPVKSIGRIHFPETTGNTNAVIYAVTANNELLWYCHSGRKDGSMSWSAPAGKKVGTGWDFKQVFSGGGGVIYGVTTGGELMWYRHDGRSDGTMKWGTSAGKKVGVGWNFKQVFSDGAGVIYAITDDN